MHIAQTPVIYKLTNTIRIALKRIKPETALNVTSYEPKKGDKLFIHSSCTIPRFKIKTFCKEYGVALVKTEVSANIKIISKRDTIKDYFISSYYYKFNKQELITIISKYNFKDVVSELMSIDSEHAYMLSTNCFGDYNTPIYKEISDLDYSHESVPYFRSEESYEDFLKLQSQTLYDQDDILKRLNTGGVMDKEQYESIQRLFNSTDTENVKLGMEAMANCDFEKSAVYLLILLREYGHAMFNCGNRNHVNFKSMLKFFNINYDIRSIGLDQIIQSLISRKLLNNDNLDRLMPEMITNMKRHSGTDYFEIDKVKPNSEVIKSIEENILDTECNTEIIDYDEEEINPN